MAKIDLQRLAKLRDLASRIDPDDYQATYEDRKAHEQYINGLFQRASGTHQETLDERLVTRGIRNFKIAMLWYCRTRADYSPEQFAEKLVKLGLADSDNCRKIAADLANRLVDYNGRPLVIEERTDEQGSVIGYSVVLRNYTDRDLMRFN